MRKSFWFGIIFFCFCLGQNSVLFGQEPISYSTKNGLPSNHIYDLQEDADGFIWIATNRGLVKFDGFEFKVFTHKNGLPNNDIVKLRLDANRRLWFFSKSSLQGFVKNDSVFVYPTYRRKVLSPRNVYAYPDGLTMSLQEEKFSNGELIKNPNYINEEKITQKFPGFKVFHIEYNHLFFFISDDEVILTDKNFVVKKKLKYYSPTGTGSFTIDYYPNQTFSVKGNSHVFFVNALTQEIKVLSYAQLGINENRTVLVKKLGNYYQVTSKKKLVVLNEKFKIIKSYDLTYTNNPEFSLLDTFGNIWAWNTKNGLEFISKNELNTQYYLYGDKINIIGEIGGREIASSEMDGTFIFDEKEKQFIKKPYFNEDSEYMIPYRITHTNAADYLLTESVIFKFDKGKWSKFNLTFNGETYTGGKDFLKFKEHNYLITPLYFLSDKGNAKIRMSGLNDLEVWQDTVFVASSDGLKYYNNKKLQPYFSKDTLLSLPINHLLKGKKYLWLGTDGRGVYGVSNGKLYHLVKTGDLSITNIIEQGDILWISTNQGIKKIRIKDAITTSYIVDKFYENDGLVQNNVNGFILKNGEIWAATDLGISVINPNASFYKGPIQVYFTDAQNELLISKKQDRNLNISFSARNYGNQNHLKFYYKLLPLHKKWIESPTRTISFNQLSPGEYTLEIMALDQHYNRGDSVLKIKVEPRWYETNIALAIFGILGILLVAGVVIFLYKVFQKRHNKAVELNRKTQELELMALRSQMNPHFVHNSLNAIQYYVQMNDVDKSEEYLTKFSELIRLFFEYSREKEITLNQEIDLLTRYIEIEQLRFEDKITYFIHIDERLDTKYQKIPTMILQPLVENSINHGLFHKQGSGRIDIYFNYISDNEFQTIIKDNGIGMEKAKEIYKNSVKNYRSHSSMVLDERLKLLNETKQWGISFSVNSNSELPNTGTEIIITIKNFDL